MEEMLRIVTVCVVIQTIGDILMIRVNMLVQGNPIADIDMRIQHSDSRRELKSACVSHKTCGHGKCNNKTGLCECLDGWSGYLCDVKKSNNTQHNKVLALSTDRTNRTKSNALTDGVPTTGAESSLSLNSLSNMKAKVEDLLQKEVQASVKTKVSSSPDRGVSKEEIKGREPRQESSRHTCGPSYKRPNLKARMCLPGFICTFGTCSSKNHNSYFSFECTCDEGAIGLFCEHKCCLDCGQHGRCSLYANGSEYCDCAFNYHGENCHLKKEVDVTGHETPIQSRKLPIMVIVGLSVISAVLLLTVGFLTLILRDRGCMTLFVVTPNCKHYQNCHKGHPHAADDAVVYYHTESPCVAVPNTALSHYSSPPRQLSHQPHVTSTSERIQDDTNTTMTVQNADERSMVDNPSYATNDT